MRSKGFAGEVVLRSRSEKRLGFCLSLILPRSLSSCCGEGSLERPESAARSRCCGDGAEAARSYSGVWWVLETFKLVGDLVTRDVEKGPLAFESCSMMLVGQAWSEVPPETMSWVSSRKENELLWHCSHYCNSTVLLKRRTILLFGLVLRE